MTGERRREFRQLQRRCAAVIADLELPVPFTLAALCDSIGARRGRPLRLAAHPASPGVSMPCGVWVALPDEDVIFIDPATSPLHQQQIGLHEVAHLLWDHGQWSTLPEEYVRRLLPNVGPEMVALLLGRTTYGDEQEREAELTATLLGERIVADSSAPVLGPRSAPGGDLTESQVLAELRRALGGKGRVAGP